SNDINDPTRWARVPTPCPDEETPPSPRGKRNGDDGADRAAGPATGSPTCHSHHRVTVVAADAAAVVGIVPVRLLLVAVAGRPLELLARHVDHIAAAGGVVGQALPGQRMVLLADPEEPAEG